MTYTMHPKILLACGALAVIASLFTGFNAGYLYLKSEVAQRLLHHAWQKAKNDEQIRKPWPWADISSIARLSYIPDSGKSEQTQAFIVLDNVSGEAMAFGPGLVAGELSNPLHNTIALGGHRDTHLAFLEHAGLGQSLQLETLDGQIYHYSLESTFVLDTRSEQLQIAADAAGLVLITCYPFHAGQTGGPLRLVARARLVSASPMKS